MQGLLLADLIENKMRASKSTTKSPYSHSSFPPLQGGFRRCTELVEVGIFYSYFNKLDLICMDILCLGT